MGLKRTVKRAALAAGRFLADGAQMDRRVVFCYHSVHPHRPYASTTPELFEEHVRWLREHCRVTTLDDLVSAAPADSGGRPTVAITFDDGYEDNHSHGLPILMRHGVTATFFVTTGLLDRDPAVLARFQRLWGCGPDDVEPLDWGQVRELRASGMRVGAHGHSHRNLARLSDAEVEGELRVPREIIADRLGEETDLLAYPFGKPRVHVRPATMAMVQATGYRLAVSVTFRGVPYPPRRYAIPRFFADSDDLSKLSAKIRGDYDPIGWWQQRAPMALMRMVSPDDFRR